MSPSFIESVVLRNYGCIRELTLPLTPLHALIGPNDVGKSTVLRGLRTLFGFATHGFDRGSAGTITPFDPQLPITSPPGGLLTVHSPGLRLQVNFADGWSYAIHDSGRGGVNEVILDHGDPRGSVDGRVAPGRYGIFQREDRRHEPGAVRLAPRLQGAALARFDGDALHASCA